MNQQPWPLAHLLPQMRRAIEGLRESTEAQSLAAEDLAGDGDDVDEAIDEQEPGPSTSGRRRTRSSAREGAQQQQPVPRRRRQRQQRQQALVEERLWISQNNMAHTVDNLLDAIGGILHTRARQVPSMDTRDQELMNPPHQAFFFPLLRSDIAVTIPSSPYDAECMVYDSEAVGRLTQRNITIDAAGYLRISLVYDRRRKPQAYITESAHRLVLWASFGPPDRDDQVVMHYCNNSNCLNPLHMVWGYQWENLSDAQQGTHIARDRIIERMGGAAQGPTQITMLHVL